MGRFVTKHCTPSSVCSETIEEIACQHIQRRLQGLLEHEVTDLTHHRSSYLSKKKLVKKHWQYYVLVAPPLLYILIFKYIPMVGAQIAFRDYDVIEGMWASQWIGLHHGILFFQSPSFLRIMGNTIFLNLLGLGIGFPAPILLALALNEIRQRYFKRTVQMVTYAPHFISTVVMVSMIITILSPRIGIMGFAMRLVGVEPIDLLSRARYFKLIYALSDVWQHAGFGAIIYLAALSGINPELYDAVKIDGASVLQKIVHIDIPGILPTIVIMLILACGNVMNVGFEKIFLMQNPLNLPASEVISTYVYKIGLIGANYSFGTAVGLFNSVINLAILVVVNYIARRISDISLW